MSNRIITLIRHGKVDGPAALYGHTDIASCDSGKIELLGNIRAIHLANPITNIISSPLIRCAHPAKDFARLHNLPLQVIEHLKEMNFGQWDGIPFDHFTNANWQSLNQFWETPGAVHAPGGETLLVFAKRIIQCWEKIVIDSTAMHQLVICHGGVIRIIIAHLLHLNWDNPRLFRQLAIDYASHTRIEISDHPTASPIITYIGAKVNSAS